MPRQIRPAHPPAGGVHRRRPRCLGANTRRDHRRADAHSLQNLQTRPATGANGANRHGRLPIEGLHVRDLPHETHPVVIGETGDLAGLTAPSHDRQPQAGTFFPQCWPNLACKPGQPLEIGSVGQAAAKEQLLRPFSLRGSGELEPLCIHAVGNAKTLNPAARLQQPAVVFRTGEKCLYRSAEILLHRQKPPAFLLPRPPSSQRGAIPGRHPAG